MPISCESQYILTCMEELLELTPNIPTHCYHNGIDVDGMVDRNENIHKLVVDSYNDWMNTGDKIDQTLVNLKSFFSLERQFKEFAQHMSEILVNLHTGKGSVDYRDRYPNLHIEKESDLTNDSNFIHLIENQIKYKEWHGLLHQHLSNTKRNIEECHINEVISREKELRQLDQIRLLQNQEFLTSFSTRNDTKFNEINLKKYKTQEAIKEKKAHKAIKKGVKLYSKLFDEKDIKTFISGNEIIIEGENYNFRVQKSHTKIISHTVYPNQCHVPYKLEMLTKDNILMAQGCVVFEDTPIIDQLIALSLHIKNGNEIELIKNTNFSNITDTYMNDALIREIKELGPKRYMNDLIDINDLTALFNADHEQRPMVQRLTRYALDNFYKFIQLDQTLTKKILYPELAFDQILDNSDNIARLPLLDIKLLSAV